MKEEASESGFITSGLLQKKKLQKKSYLCFHFYVIWLRSAFNPSLLIASCSLVLTHAHTHTQTHTRSSSLEAGATRQLVGGPVSEAGGGLGQQVSGPFSFHETRRFLSAKPVLKDLKHRLHQRPGEWFHLPLLSLPLAPLPVLRHTGGLGTGTWSDPGTLPTGSCSRGYYLGWTDGHIWDGSRFPHGPRYLFLPCGVDKRTPALSYTNIRHVLIPPRTF